MMFRQKSVPCYLETTYSFLDTFFFFFRNTKRVPINSFTKIIRAKMFGQSSSLGLPLEIYEKIFRYLKLEDLKIAARVNR